MAQVNVTQTLDSGSDALWAVVRDFSDVRWIPGGENGEIRGEGPGMLRIFQGPDGAVHERLDSVDEGSRTVVYSIPQGAPFPVSSYKATMHVSDDGGKARLSWTCDFEPKGASEEQVAKTIETLYGVMIGWIGNLLAGGSD